MARWHSCIVLQPGQDARRLWQFNPSGDKFTLQRTETKLPNEPLPEKLIGKDWHTLLQPKLNIAWLPANKVFLRVVQLPRSDHAETQSMVDLQLEKLSPLPTNQIVWSFEVLPPTSGAFAALQAAELQTVIVIIVARSYVEEFLGQLEGLGYLADRLELALLDQLRATKVREDGAWIFPGSGAETGSCLVAWWYGGVLQNVTLLHLPPNEKRATQLTDQLSQMTWAGELEGWLTGTPRYHLVADDAVAAEWLPLFGLDQNVEVVPPVPAPELAALTARRAAGNGVGANLLPPEFAARYKQQLIDRLWMRLVGVVFVLYLFGLLIYFGWVQWEKFRLDGRQTTAMALSVNYTNTLQLKEKVRVLQDQLDLQFAALDCWKAVADLLPPEMTLDTISFDRGQTLKLNGSASKDDRLKIYEFNESLIKVLVKNQPLFAKVGAPRVNERPGTGLVNWDFTCDLKRKENE